MYFSVTTSKHLCFREQKTKAKNKTQQKNNNKHLLKHWQNYLGIGFDSPFFPSYFFSEFMVSQFFVIFLNFHFLPFFFVIWMWIFVYSQQIYDQNVKCAWRNYTAKLSRQGVKSPTKEKQKLMKKKKLQYAIANKTG